MQWWLWLLRTVFDEEIITNSSTANPIAPTHFTTFATPTPFIASTTCALPTTLIVLTPSHTQCINTVYHLYYSHTTQCSLRTHLPSFPLYPHCPPLALQPHHPTLTFIFHSLPLMQLYCYAVYVTSLASEFSEMYQSCGLASQASSNY